MREAGGPAADALLAHASGRTLHDGRRRTRDRFATVSYRKRNGTPVGRARARGVPQPRVTSRRKNESAVERTRGDTRFLLYPLSLKHESASRPCHCERSVAI